MGILNKKPENFVPVLMRPAKNVTFKACCKTCIHYRRMVVGDWEWSYELHKCNLGAPDKNLDSLPGIRNLTDHYCEDWMPHPAEVEAELEREESKT